VHVADVPARSDLAGEIKQYGGLARVWTRNYCQDVPFSDKAWIDPARVCDSRHFFLRQLVIIEPGHGLSGTADYLRADGDEILSKGCAHSRIAAARTAERSIRS
jgi:hypothetical protein